MMNDCGCEHDPATWAARVEFSCAKQGFQLTPMRRRVMDVFSDSDAPLGAYAILEELSRRGGKQVAPPSVYRALEFFLGHGFVHRIESLNAYAPCEHLGHAHHGMLLICETCGRSEEIEDLEAMRAVAATAARAGFGLRRVMIEANGVCRRCAAREAPAAAGA